MPRPSDSILRMRGRSLSPRRRSRRSRQCSLRKLSPIRSIQPKGWISSVGARMRATIITNLALGPPVSWSGVTGHEKRWTLRYQVGGHNYRPLETPLFVGCERKFGITVFSSFPSALIISVLADTDRFSGCCVNGGGFIINGVACRPGIELWQTRMQSGRAKLCLRPHPPPETPLIRLPNR
jgi:hypothetical protein